MANGTVQIKEQTNCIKTKTKSKGNKDISTRLSITTFSLKSFSASSSQLSATSWSATSASQSSATSSSTQWIIMIFYTPGHLEYSITKKFLLFREYLINRGKSTVLAGENSWFKIENSLPIYCLKWCHRFNLFSLTFPTHLRCNRWIVAIMVWIELII